MQEARPHAVGRAIAEIGRPAFDAVDHVPIDNYSMPSFRPRGAFPLRMVAPEAGLPNGAAGSRPAGADLRFRVPLQVIDALLRSR